MIKPILIRVTRASDDKVTIEFANKSGLTESYEVTWLDIYRLGEAAKFIKDSTGSVGFTPEREE